MNNAITQPEDNPVQPQDAISGNDGKSSLRQGSDGCAERRRRTIERLREDAARPENNQADPAGVVKRVTGQQAEAGFQTRKILGRTLKGRHVNRLVALWKRQGVSDTTIKNRLAIVRWWTGNTGEPGAVKTKEEYGSGLYSPVTVTGDEYFLKQMDAGLPPWAEDIPDMQPQPVPDRESSPFVTQILREEGMSVCLDRVTGHDDLRFRGMSWRELLEHTQAGNAVLQPDRVICVSENGVDWTVTQGLLSVCRARFQCDRENRLPVLSNVHLTTLTVDTVMKEACSELTRSLSDPSFPVCGTIIAFRNYTGIQDGPGWRRISYQPVLSVQLYGDTTGRLPENVTCQHVQDVYRLLSALSDAERDIRIRNKTTSLRSWWHRFAGRVQG
ncbi:TPA: hypothetical protein LC247_004059 [Salmonella enterica subsp. diarizonae serovar 50:r:z]|nr:hypothetical protein [Salmonella enterica subsp. diarizonae serovar 50:r:z]